MADPAFDDVECRQVVHRLEEAAEVVDHAVVVRQRGGVAGVVCRIQGEGLASARKLTQCLLHLCM